LILKYTIKYNIFRTFVLAPDERRTPHMKKEYIAEINKLLPNADVELLDFIYQLLQKSVDVSFTPLEMNPQTA
jgi:hypothetical protein